MYSKYQFLKNKKILVTGHTGFIGAWLCLMLILLELNFQEYHYLLQIQIKLLII